MYLLGLVMLWVFLIGLGVLMMAPLLFAAGLLFMGWVPAVMVGESLYTLHIECHMTLCLCMRMHCQYSILSSCNR